MKRMTWLKGALALTVLSAASWAMAADHIDAPATIADPTADITDLYSWTDQGNVVFALNVTPLAMPGAKFSDKVQYVIHTESAMKFGMAGEKSDIIITFDANQKASVWVGDKGYVTGDASMVTGLASADGKFKVFAGLRADPFFFNLDGFKATVNFIDTNKAALLAGANDAGCPTVDNVTSGAAVNSLKTTDGGTAVDFFKKLNGLAIVVQVDKTLVTKGGPIVSVWGSTHKKS